MDLKQSLTTDTLAHLSAGEPLVLSSGATVLEAVMAMRAVGLGYVLACKGEALVGILTERDVLRMIAEGQELRVPLREAMTSNPVTLGPGDSVAVAIHHMNRGGYRRLPVLDDAGRPVGVVSSKEIVHYLVEHFPQAVYNQPPTAEVTTRDREGA